MAILQSTEVSGSLSISGSLTAQSFVGDGSSITGVISEAPAGTVSGSAQVVALLGSHSGNVGIGTASPSANLDIVGGGGYASPTLELNSSTSTPFNHAINAFNSNLTSGENQIIVVGKEGNTKNSGYIGYTWNGAGSNSNLITFGHWDNNNLVNIDGLGNVGIGTTSPGSKLDVIGNTRAYSVIGTADDVRTGIAHYDTTAQAAGVGGQLVLGYKYTNAGAYAEGAILKMYKENSVSGEYGSGLKFQVRNHGYSLSTKMTLDPSGNVLVGKTAVAFETAGVALQSTGSTYITRDGGNPLDIRRNTNDGDILKFWKDSTTVGSIGSISSDLYIAEGSVGLRFDGENNQILPSSTTASTDNTCNLGASGARFKDLHLGGTATVGSLVETSTRKLKKDITELEDQSSIVDSLQPVSYTWKETEKEDFGLIAEDVAGIAPHLVERDEEGNPSGIKYSKLSVLLLDVVQRQSTLIEDLNKRITKLENERGN